MTFPVRRAGPHGTFRPQGRADLSRSAVPASRSSVASCCDTADGGTGGVPDAEQLARTVAAARAAGRQVRSVIVTLPDNPDGTPGVSRGRAVAVLGSPRRTI